MLLLCLHLQQQQQQQHGRHSSKCTTTSLNRCNPGQHPLRSCIYMKQYNNTMATESSVTTSFSLDSLLTCSQ
jgi:hypothetical protein